MESLRRIPSFLILFLWIGYLGWQAYEFQFSPGGEVEAHIARISAMKRELKELNNKYQEGQSFLKTLDAKKEEVRALAKKLAEFQGALSEQADSAGLMKILLTEAKKIGLRVDRIEPGKKTTRPFYIEQESRLELRGTFQQLHLFVYRVSRMQRILRIENFHFRPAPVGAGTANLPLSAELGVSSYQYVMSQEDSLVKAEGAK
jgi:Tfp pilus assembly protein PilO